MANHSRALAPVHRRNGYSLHIMRRFSGDFAISLRHKGKEVGVIEIESSRPKRGKPSINPSNVWLYPEHRGKGLGFRMYDAAFQFAKNKLGITEVRGQAHSEDAHRIHKAIAQKYGVRYTAVPVRARPIDFGEEIGYVQPKYGSYRYTIKKEA